MAESGVAEKVAKGSDSLPRKEEPDFPGHPHGTGVDAARSSPQRLQPLSLTNRIHHSHPDFIPSPFPSHHTHGRGKTAGRVALELHRHLYTQGAGSIPAVGSALHPWLGR